MVFNILVFHFFVYTILLYSAFETFWTTVYVPDVPVTLGVSDPPAKRVVLIIMDGVRSDCMWHVLESHNGTVANAKKLGGSHGEAISRMPTVTKPCVLAITSGALVNTLQQYIYGLFGQTIRFPTIFDFASPSLYFGYRDIIEIFKWHNGSDPFYYKKLHHWVSGMKHLTCDDALMEAFEDLYENSNKNETLGTILQSSRMAIYFHFSNTDFSGHFYGPTGQKTLKNIEKSLSRIDEISSLMDVHYKDNGTAFIVCSDHGMTMEGKHGGGTWDELRTPIIAWGPGIAACKEKQLFRQVDITVLISILIGTSIPPNSIGKLPLFLLDLAPKQRAQSVAINAFQAATLSETIYNRLSFLFNKLFFHAESIRLMRNNVSQLMDAENYTEAETLSLQLRYLATKSFKNYETVIKTISIFVQMAILLGSCYLCLQGGILHCSCSNKICKKELSHGERNEICAVPGNNKENTSRVEKYGKQQNESVIHSDKNSTSCNKMNLIADIPLFIWSISVLLILISLELPVQYYLYLTISIVLWRFNFTRIYKQEKVNRESLTHVIILLIFCALTAEYLYRSFFGDIPIGLAPGILALLPIFFNWKANMKFATVWYLGLGSLVILGKTVKLFGTTGSRTALYTSSCVCMVASLAAPTFLGGQFLDSVIALGITCVQMLAIGLQITADSLTGWGSVAGKKKVKFPPILYNSIIVLFTSSILAIVALAPLLQRRSPSCYITHAASLLAVPLILLSTGFEPLVLVCLTSLTFAMIHLNQHKFNRICEAPWGAIFCYLITASYLTSGNIASLTSFNIDWTRNIVRKLHEVQIAILIVVKYVCIFSVVVGPFVVLTKVREAGLQKTLLTIYAILDLMAIRSFLSFLTSGQIFKNTDTFKITSEEPFTALSKYCCTLLLIILIDVTLLINLYFKRLNNYNKRLIKL